MRRPGEGRRRRAVPAAGGGEQTRVVFLRRGVIFFSRWRGRSGAGEAVRGSPPPPPLLPHGPAEVGGGRAGTRGGPRAWRGPPSPAGARHPSGLSWGDRRAPAGAGAAGAPLPRTCGFGQDCTAGGDRCPRVCLSRSRSVEPSRAAPSPSLHDTSLSQPRFCPRPPAASSGRYERPLLPGPAGPPSPSARGESLCGGIRVGKGGGGGRRLALSTGKIPFAWSRSARGRCAPRSPVGGERSPGRGATAGRWSREEGKAEARLLVRIVIFHQSPAICVSAPDRTPAVLLAGVTETTQRWRRANCICSPAHRSKLRPSHGAGKGAKGPCDMREI